jgi:hypothetical protein
LVRPTAAGRTTARVGPRGAGGGSPIAEEPKRSSPMDATPFDRVAKRVAACRSRHRALAEAAAGLAPAATAQEATPAPAGQAGEKVQFLFVQSFRSGSIAPKAGTDGAYTLTLEHGLGQTIYFSDRPERVVGADPTPQFLKGFGFQQQFQKRL